MSRINTSNYFWEEIKTYICCVDPLRMSQCRLLSQLLTPIFIIIIILLPTDKISIPSEIFGRVTCSESTVWNFYQIRLDFRSVLMHKKSTVPSKYCTNDVKIAQTFGIQNTHGTIQKSYGVFVTIHNTVCPFLLHFSLQQISCSIKMYTDLCAFQAIFFRI